MAGTTAVYAFRSDATGKDRVHNLTGIAPTGYAANPRETLYDALPPP